jgi:hypothetical protein
MPGVTLAVRDLMDPPPVTEVYASLYPVLGAGALLAFAVFLRRTGRSVAELPADTRAA